MFSYYFLEDQAANVCFLIKGACTVGVQEDLISGRLINV